MKKMIGQNLLNSLRTQCNTKNDEEEEDHMEGGALQADWK